MTTEDCTAPEYRAPAWWPAFVWAAVLAFALAGVGYVLHGKPLAEKTLTTLAMPIGALWLLLSGRIMQLVLQRHWRGVMPLVGLWLAFILFGTRPIPKLVTQWIETSVETYLPDRDGPLDVVVVLGGGTTQGPWRPQVGGAGDRVIMAAELYHLGLAKRLITTGQTTEGVSALQPAPSEQTREIWTKLKVDPQAIRMIGGRNTFEEMQQLKQISSEYEGQRIGLLTSGLHLPRAMRLAKAQGLQVVPIAADVRTAADDWGLLAFLPSAGNFTDLASAQHELMAALLAR